MTREPELQAADNLRRWQQSGTPRLWVEARQGQWSHDDWLTLLDDLAASPYWPLEPEEVGRVLEEVGEKVRNLRRWEESGEARRWAEARQGRWGDEDRPALRETLRRSEFWPLDLEAAEKGMDRVAAQVRNLRRWRDSGAARRWVEAKAGQWGHVDWLGLLETLRQTGFWPVDPAEVARVLKEVQRKWWNLRRWRDSGLAHRWVEGRPRRWRREDWRALEEELRASEFWPVDRAALGRVVKEVRAQARNLCRWQESGAAQRWAASFRGAWDRPAWRVLLDALRPSEFWPLDPMAVWRVAERLLAPVRQTA
jgi:hypothetical protein